MKWVCGLLLCMLCLTGFARAEEPPALPAPVRALCESAYPGYEIAVCDGWGNDDRGQFALVLSKDEAKTLCIAEKAAEGAAYRFTVENPCAVHQGDDLPSVYIDTGGDSLFYSYHMEFATHSYHAVKGADGAWGGMGATAYDTSNNEEYHFYLRDDFLWISYCRTDGNDNILERYEYVPVPGGAWRGMNALSAFDIEAYPCDFHTLFNEASLPAIAEALLPEGSVALDGVTTAYALYLLADDADGSRRAYICEYDEDTGFQVTQSAALPENASLDTFHAWSSIEVEWQEDGDWRGYEFAKQPDGRWGLSYVMSEDWFGVYDCYITEPNDLFARHHGKHPWNDVRHVDFLALPKSFAEALAQLDTSAIAVVHNDVPTNRLHLRKEPDKSSASLGKYYDGTVVEVLENRGDWARVAVAGVEGWMMTRYLAFGEAMNAVENAFPVLALLDNLYDTGVDVYHAPDDRLAPVGKCRSVREIIGVVGDEWFHVVFEGIQGYVKQDCFWEGNG